MHTPTPTNRIWPSWWRFAGIDGILFAVLFIVGNGISGESPGSDDSIEEIRRYFTDDAQTYLIGDYIIGIAFVLLLLPYVIGLSWYLARAEGTPPIWSTMTFTGGLVAVIFGGAASILWGGLAVGLESNPELDEGTIRFIMDADAYGFSLMSFGLALFIGSAGFVVFRTGVLWRWLGAMALFAAPLLIIGTAWPIDGDQEGALATIAIPGLLLTVLFIIISSIALIMRKELPPIDGEA